jgi:hypothetical protein
VKRHRKFKPYIRLANGREKSSSFREAFRLAFYQSLGRPFYVMVQHGFPTLAIAVGPSRHDIQQSILVVRMRRKTFPEWSRSTQKFSTGKKAVAK